MQNAWRFVKAPGLRDRLKEAKGIGTPATRAEIIKGLKQQNLLTADGTFVVPTSAGYRYSSSFGGPRQVSSTQRQRQHGRCSWTILFLAQRRFPVGYRRHRHDGGPVDRGFPGAFREARSTWTAPSSRNRPWTASAPGGRRSGGPSKEPRSAARAPRQRRSAKHAQANGIRRHCPSETYHNHSGKTEGARTAAEDGRLCEKPGGEARRSNCPRGLLKTSKPAAAFSINMPGDIGVHGARCNQPSSNPGRYSKRSPASRPALKAAGSTIRRPHAPAPETPGPAALSPRR